MPEKIEQTNNYTIYIIAILVMLAVGFFIYAMSMPQQNNMTANQQKMNQQDYIMADGNAEETNSQINATQTATTTINNATTTKTSNTKMKATYTIKMETSKGNITLELDTNIAPKTVENFVKLANAGFYDGTKFHRVIKDFMIQGGDPLSKDDTQKQAWGTGGPGYKFADEISDPATYQKGYKRGILAMANSGPNTNGSQFFIMHKDTPLPPNYTIFGHVLSGLETVDAIAAVQTTGPGNRPVSDVVINKVSAE